MANESSPVLPEWATAIYDAVRILMARGYLHSPKDVEFVRPRYKPVFPCGRCTHYRSNLRNESLWAIIHHGAATYKFY